MLARFGPSSSRKEMPLPSLCCSYMSEMEVKENGNAKEVSGNRMIGGRKLTRGEWGGGGADMKNWK